jgi:hypothetical protein
MAIQINDVMSIMPAITQKVGQKIQVAYSIPDRASAVFRKGTPLRTNAKGAREYVEVTENTQVGSTQEDGVFNVGGGYGMVELLINSVRIHISGKATGDQIRNAPDVKAAGVTVAKRMMKDFRVLRNWQNINFCRGDGLASHGTVASVSYSAPYTTVTFESTNGSFYIKKGAYYFPHAPSGTFAVRGANGTTPYQCYDKPTKLTARFFGDMTGGTPAQAGDLICARATADGESFVNRGVRGLVHWAATTGDYFGVDRDVVDLLRGVRVSGGSDLISHSLLAQADGLHHYRNGDEDTDTSNFMDMFAPAQKEAYLLNAYGIRRLDTADYQNYDGAAKFKGDGGRRSVCDKYLPDTSWFRLKQSEGYRYSLAEMDIWDLDGQKFRTPTVSGSNRDSIQWTIFGDENFAHKEPWNVIEVHTLATTGVATKVS